MLGAGTVIVERGSGRWGRKPPALASYPGIRSAGDAKATPGSEASGARKRTPAALVARETGITRSGGRARGLCWLQKSTSGARSRSKGHGSSSLARTRSRGRAQRVKRRRKPGRGGESHEHASSDTGGGLLVIPRAARASAVRDRGREHSAMEGVLVRRKPPSLTRRRERRAWVIRSDGDARCSRERGAGSAEGRDRGRQRLRRKLGARSKRPRPGDTARRSRRSGLRQDRAVSFTWASGASAPGRGFEPPLATRRTA